MAFRAKSLKGFLINVSPAFFFFTGQKTKQKDNFDQKKKKNRKTTVLNRFGKPVDNIVLLMKSLVPISNAARSFSIPC